MTSWSTTRMAQQVTVMSMLLLTACGGRQQSSATVDASASDSESTSDAADAPSFDSPSSDGRIFDAGVPLLDPSPCLVGGDVFYLAHSDLATSPSITMTSPSSIFSGNIQPNSVAMGISEQGPPYPGPVYGFQLRSNVDDAGFPVLPFQLGIVYAVADEQPLHPNPGEPVLEVDTSWGCDESSGSFVVSALSVTPTVAQDVTVAFLYSACNGPIISGCLHVENMPQSQ